MFKIVQSLTRSAARSQRSLSVILDFPLSCPSNSLSGGCHKSINKLSEISSRNVSSFALKFSEYGDPPKVLSKVDTTQETSRALGSKEVLLEMLASPVNPADINTIQGVYAVKPTLPAVGGNEGVARVADVGPEVNTLAVNDWVIPAQAGMGTWRSHAICPASDLIKVDNKLHLYAASQIAVNPCTAYRMLKDFVNLNRGDCVIQNGANSAVGVYVIQLAREWGLITINVIRDRPNLDSLRDSLIKYGATWVVTEEELRQKEIMQKIYSDGTPKPRLALNCVGGKNSSDCMRQLETGGVMVTYGGMSRQPVAVPTGSLIFQDITLRGYWMTAWNRAQGNQSLDREAMLAELTNLYKKKAIRPQHAEFVKPDDFAAITEKTMAGFANTKYIFRFND